MVALTHGARRGRLIQRPQSSKFSMERTFKCATAAANWDTVTTNTRSIAMQHGVAHLTK